MQNEQQTPAAGSDDPAAAEVVGPSETRARILEAAVGEFAERGFAGARVDRIATDAGLNKQLIYRYFGNKQGLYEAAFGSLVHQVRGGTAGEVDGASVVRGMLGDSEVGAEHVTDSIVRFIAWESLSGQASSGELHEERAANYRAAIEWVRGQQEAGGLRDDVPAEFVTALIAAAGGVPYTMPSVLRFVLEQPELDAGVREDWRDFIWAVLQSV